MSQRSFRACPKDGIAWVTGASSGIGRNVALELARRGFRVAATARRADELQSLAARGAPIMAFPGDVIDRDSMARLVTQIEDSMGPITLAFLNAGVYFPEERDGFSARIVWRTFEVNVGGTVNCLDPLIGAMTRRGRGQIAMTSSLAGYGGIPGSTGYGATKAALIVMAEALRLTYEERGLTVQIVNPGFVRTPMVGHVDFEMPFLMEPEEAASIICDGFARAGFEITFPRRLAYAFKFATLLPYPLFLWIMRRATARARG